MKYLKTVNITNILSKIEYITILIDIEKNSMYFQ